MKRFLGMNGGQYGDLYLGTVAARCLKAAEPDSHLTYVISADYAECTPVFIDHPHIDRIHVLHKPRDGFDQVDLDWIAGQGFTHVFNPMQDHDHARPWWRERNQPLESAHMHGISTGADAGKIEMTRWFKPIVDPDLGPCVALAPFPAFYAGVTNDKAFPMRLAEEVVRYVRSKHLAVLQVGAPNEPQVEGAIKLNESYFTTVRTLLGCRAFIGGDSGLMWLMSGYDFPCLGLYGARYYSSQFVHHIQPLNDRAVYLHREHMTDFTIDDLIPAIDQLLA